MFYISSISYIFKVPIQHMDKKKEDAFVASSIELIVEKKNYFSVLKNERAPFVSTFTTILFSPFVSSTK